MNTDLDIVVKYLTALQEQMIKDNNPFIYDKNRSVLEVIILLKDTYTKINMNNEFLS